jgi:hypothetical protein
MPKISRQVGATSQIVEVVAQSTASSPAGLPLSGLVYNTSGLTCYYKRNSASADVAVTLATIATLGSFASGGFAAVDGANMIGLYEFHLPNAALASGADNVVFCFQGAANLAPLFLEIELTAINNQSTGFGLLNVSSNLVEIAGSAVSTSTAQLGVNVVQYNAHTAVTDGNNYPSVNLVDIAGSAVSTSTAQLGVNAVNIAGQAAQLDANNLLKVDLVDIAGTAVSASTAQLGVNLVNIAGSAVSTSTAQLGVNAVNIAGHAATLDGNNLLQVDLVDIGGSAVSSSTAQLGVNVVNWGGTATHGAIPPDVVFVRSGTAQAGGASTITLDAGASATNNFYQNQIVFIRSGTGAGESAMITSYVGSTKVATIVGSWATNPDSTSVFSILPFGSITTTVSGGVNVTQWNGSAVAAPNVAGVPLVDLGYVAGSAVNTAAAQLGVNAVNIAGQAAQLDGNNLLKVDLVDIAGSAVSASTAQLGVNAVNIAGHAAQLDANNLLKVDLVDVAGTASAGAAGYMAVDWSAINAPTSSVNLSGTTISTAQAVASAAFVVNAPFKINTANGFEVSMVSSSDHVTPYTAGGVSCVRSIAGASESSVSGTITQIGSTNRYYFAGQAADFNGTSIGFNFSASGADSVLVSVNTQP